MHIMEIVSCSGLSGATIHCLLLTRELARRGHRLTLVCRPDAWIGKQLEDDPVEIVRSDLHRWPTDELRRVASIIREREVDVVHTHLSRAHFFGILLRWFARIPSVATAHSRHIQLHWMFNDRVIAVSEASRHYQRTRNFVRNSRIETIHNFIDHERIAGAAPDARARIRREFGVGDGSFLIGTIGNVIPRKGAIYLVDAMPKILATAPDSYLMLVGQTWPREYAEKVRSRSEELGVASRVIWTGLRNDIHDVMSSLDLYTVASLEESLPLAILEAMAAKLAVVATGVGGIPECVEEGVTGTLVRPADSDALAEAIVALYLDPARRLKYGQAGCRRVEENFSPNSQTSRLEEVFTKVVGRRQAA